MNIHVLPLGYPLPQSESTSSPGFSLNFQFFKAASRVTLAQILAALTIGNKESAFLDTVIFNWGNMDDNLA